MLSALAQYMQSLDWSRPHWGWMCVGTIGGLVLGKLLDRMGGK